MIRTSNKYLFIENFLDFQRKKEKEDSYKYKNFLDNIQNLSNEELIGKVKESFNDIQ